ncbi:MotA/TolQ/ExbB proton channel family protein [Burkholderiaceae bacterium DAT-1]|nr:MotA/TolQ/ExbB proton channel family protein [Burkholderiaceae bacterium DAT-1]
MSVANRLSALIAAVALVAAPAATLFVSQAAYAEDAAPAAAAPAADAAAPAAAPAAEAAKDAAAPAGEQHTPNELVHAWESGDSVSHGTFIILLIMSVASWYILFTKLWEQSKLNRQAKAARENFWSSGSVKTGVGALDDGSAFRYIAETALTASEHHEGALLEQIDLNTWVGNAIERSVDNVNSRLQDGLAVLATVGSTSPFIGLFGTVWGIKNALGTIAQSGQPSIDKVAGPVGEALIMTAFGLFVAVPAVLAYNWLIRRNKGAMEQVRAFAADLHNVLIGGGKAAKRG